MVQDQWRHREPEPNYKKVETTLDTKSENLLAFLTKAENHMLKNQKFYKLQWTLNWKNQSFLAQKPKTGFKKNSQNHPNRKSQCPPL